MKSCDFYCKRHILAWIDVDWAILRENRLMGLTSRAVGEKSQKVTRGSHRNDVSPLTQGLRYRAACDRNCICAFDWHEDRLPWMTLNWYQFEFLRELRGISQILEATTAKRMNRDPYCQRQRCSSLIMYFSTFLALICRRFLHALTLALARLSCSTYVQGLKSKTIVSKVWNTF